VALVDLSALTWSKEFPALAKRPTNSQLALEKLEKKFNLNMPSWDRSLQLCMQEYFALCR